MNTLVKITRNINIFFVESNINQHIGNSKEYSQNEYLLQCALPEH